MESEPKQVPPPYTEGGYVPPTQQPGYPNPPGYPPSYTNQQPSYPPPPTGPTYVTVQPTSVPPTSVVIMGGCPACRTGVLRDEFTCMGICCCVLFFPIGLLCLFTMRRKACLNCGARF